MAAAVAPTTTITASRASKSCEAFLASHREAEPWVTPDAAPLGKELLLEGLRRQEGRGYAHSCGLVAVRQKIADFYTSPAAAVSPNDIAITPGYRGALELAIGVLCNPGDSVILPETSPGLVVCAAAGVTSRPYRSVASEGRVDVPQLARLIDASTRAIVVHSSSCMANLGAVLQLAGLYKLPVILDEVAETSLSVRFQPPATPPMDKEDSPPLLRIGGTDAFGLPGWQAGWIVIHDRQPEPVLATVRAGLLNMTTVVLGSCTATQLAIPGLLEKAAKQQHQ